MLTFIKIAMSTLLKRMAKVKSPQLKLVRNAIIPWRFARSPLGRRLEQQLRAPARQPRAPTRQRMDGFSCFSFSLLVVFPFFSFAQT
jgi:hypothetical protein